MPRSISTYIAATLALVVLVGCQVAVGDPPEPPEPDHSFSAEGPVYPPEPSPRGTVFLPANQDVLVRVSSGNVGSDPRRLLVFEIDATPGTRLEVRSATGGVLGASRSPDFWASSMAHASTAAAGAVERSAVTRAASGRAAGERRAPVEPESIGVAWTCLGPCVAVRPPAGSSRDYYLHLRSSTSQEVAVFAYRFAEQDENEPNDTPGTATVIPGSTGGQTVVGAIERLRDDDHFQIAGSGWGTGFVDVEITAPTADDLNIYLEFLEDGFRLFPGDDPIIADVGERFVVRAHDGGEARAGPASDSRYNVFIDPI